jgi:hypothetical protein
MSANFSDLQSVDTANGADQMMLRLNNGATGPDGFARIEISDLNSVFTSNLTASDANVKLLSAQWSEAYSQVNANSGVFALTVSNSAQWDAAYDAVTGQDFNFGDKHFDYVTINGPFNPDVNRSTLPVFIVKRDPTTTADMVQVIPVNTSSMFRITTAGEVGIKINENYNFATNEVLFVNGNQRIDGLGGNALTINGDMVVNGSLSALSATFINSSVRQTSALSISSNGGGPALFVNQYDIGSGERIVEFKSNAATTTFQGNGDITGFRNLSGYGRIIAGVGNTASNASSYIIGTSNNDNNNANVFILGNNIIASTPSYTYVTNLSAAGAGVVAAGGGTSNTWNLAYALVTGQSALFLSLFSTVLSQSANNASMYSTVSANSATWGSVSTIFNVVSAINTSALTAVGLSANINAALVAKGAGATLAQIPDNAVAGGNARGLYATDWQKSRINADQVASGEKSTIGGGSNHTASGTSSTIAGGLGLTAANFASTACGGRNNRAGSNYAFVGGGDGNAALDAYCTVGGGRGNDASGTAFGYSIIGGGRSNDASGDYSAIGGGYQNTASADYSTVAGGGSNTASADSATVGGGSGNNAAGVASTIAGGTGNSTGYLAAVGGGFSNDASADSATIGGGYNNTASSQRATVAGGAGNTASGDYSTVCGGYANTASAQYSTSLGYGANATNYGEFAIGSGWFNLDNDNKSSTFLLRTTTTAAGSAAVYLDSSSAEITLSANSTYAYTATIVGLSSHNDSAHLHYTLRGVAKCNSSGVVTIYNQTAADAVVKTSRIPATLNAALSGTSNNKLRVVVYTPSTANHYWTARIQAEYIQF